MKKNTGSTKKDEVKSRKVSASKSETKTVQRAESLAATVSHRVASTISTVTSNVDFLSLAPQELHSFRSFLLSQKSAILNRSMEFQQRQRAGRESGVDEAELASSEVSENLSLHLYERDRGLLFQIERALSRITLGTFGKCEGCSEPIGLKRLRVRPFSTLCLECTEEREDTH